MEPVRLGEIVVRLCDVLLFQRKRSRLGLSRLRAMVLAWCAISVARVEKTLRTW